MDDRRVVHLRLCSRGSRRRRYTYTGSAYRCGAGFGAGRPGTPAPAERTAQVQGKAPGPRVAQQKTPGPCAARPEVRGPHVARPRAPGPRSAQQGSPGTVSVYWENLQGKDRQENVLNHRVSRKQRFQLGGRRRCGGGGVGEIRLVKDDVSGDQDAARGEVKASVPLVVRGVTKKHNKSSGAPACEEQWRRC